MGEQRITGICPTQGGKEYTISVDYLDMSTTSEKIYKKDLCSCKYRAEHTCPEKECPIYKSAPEML